MNGLDESYPRVEEGHTDLQVRYADQSAVSWAAVFAGALAAAAMSLVLFILGIGLGLSSVSPWTQQGLDADSFGVSTILWITFTSFVAAGLGGYLCGRLRTRWVSVHTDEVYFRDTVHGFLAWSLATLVTAVLFTTIGAALVTGAVKTGTSVIGSAALASSQVATDELEEELDGVLDYYSAKYLRTGINGSNLGPDGSTSLLESEDVKQILSRAQQQESLSTEDASYLEEIIQQRTGMNRQQAASSVSDMFEDLNANMQSLEEEARAAAEQAREISVKTALWFFIALLIGAFIASFSATLGGRQNITSRFAD